MEKRINAEEILSTFLEYTKINTTSDPASQTLPSSDNQYKLAQHVINQCSGLDGIAIDIKSNAITKISIPANTTNTPSIVFFAHLDTAPEHKGDTHAIRIQQYDGKAIIQPGTDGVISPEHHPELLDYVGQDLIITDGTSLLGADDKAAIAAGVEALKYLINNQDVPHGDIHLVLLPDEEIGILGAKALEVDELNADYGICLDCCSIGEYVIENWYAGSARITVKGVTAHPMSAKGKLINALSVATEVTAALPANERPEYTEGREGYYWPHKLSGDTSSAILDIAIRDFDIDGYRKRKATLQDIVDKLNQRWGDERISITLSDTYDNVKPGLDKNPAILKNVVQAMHNLGITPKPLVMRGGYDGSVITPKGLPTVNIFTGAHNFHSTKEFLPVESLRLACEMLLEIVKLSCSEDHQ